MARVRFPAGATDFFFSIPQRPDRTGAHPVSYLMGTGALSQGKKRPGRKADHSPPSCTEVKNDGAISPLPIRLYGVMIN
jgi:hypothetical protein